MQVTSVTWGRRLEELIRGGDNFVFNTFLYLEPVQRYKNSVGLRLTGRPKITEGLGTCLPTSVHNVGHGWTSAV